ncbi:hypothetical protein, partial [Bartonella sp. AA33NXGY]|uniref:hypothetical protein n=1 Tax=Bartonella sp. AA33NXGY TaxID=3243433 RepID=UPI0035D10E68
MLILIVHSDLTGYYFIFCTQKCLYKNTSSQAKKEQPIKKENHLNACLSFFHESFKLISLSEKSAVYALKDT